MCCCDQAISPKGMILAITAMRANSATSLPFSGTLTPLSRAMTNSAAAPMPTRPSTMVSGRISAMATLPKKKEPPQIIDSSTSAAQSEVAMGNGPAAGRDAASPVRATGSEADMPQAPATARIKIKKSRDIGFPLGNFHPFSLMPPCHHAERAITANTL